MLISRTKLIHSGFVVTCSYFEPVTFAALSHRFDSDIILRYFQHSFQWKLGA